MNQSPDTVALYVDAGAKVNDLQNDLQTVWNELRNEPKAAADIASILQVDAADLQRLDKVPVLVSSPHSGLAAGEIAVLVATWIATDVVLKALSDLGKEVVKSALLKLWDKHLEKRVAARQKIPRPLGDRQRRNG